MLAYDFAIHHNLPHVGLHIDVIEAPIEPLSSDGLVGRIVICCEVGMRERFSGSYSLPLVEDKHLFQELKG
jgi:hypothetical protein